MTDIGMDEMLSVKQLCRSFPGRNGRGISRATIVRWMFHGVRGVRLASTKIGGARYATREAVAQFVTALNDRPAPAKVDHNRNAQRVERLLAAEGF